MIFHENRLPADDSHEQSYLICCFLKEWQNLKLSSELHIIGDALWLKTCSK